MKGIKILAVFLVLSCLLSACSIKNVVNLLKQEYSAGNAAPTHDATLPAETTLPPETTIPAETAAPTEPQSSAQTFYVNVDDNLFIRSGPGTQYEKVGMLRRETPVSVLYFEGDWARIEQGWVNKTYLSDVPPLHRAGLVTTPEVISTESNYQIIRANCSYYSHTGHPEILHYYDYVSLLGTSPAIQSINTQLRQMAESFLWPQDYVLNSADEYKAMGYGGTWYNTKEATVSYISDRYVSITVEITWYMGGTSNTGVEGHVFDLQTGAPLTLYHFANGNPTAFEQQLKAIAWNQICLMGTPWDNSYEKLYAYTLDTMDFSISNGQILLHFPEYEFFPGAAPHIIIYTGIYV